MAAVEDERGAGDAARDPVTLPDGDDARSDALREQLGEMRGEADRIAALDTGVEQVAAAEAFVDAAGALDEQVGAAARAAGERRG